MAETLLLHFDDTHGHAQHLLWSTDNPDELLMVVRCGGGPGLARAFLDRGVRFEVVARWPGAAEMRSALRRAHNNRRFCRRCLYGRARQLRLW